MRVTVDVTVMISGGMLNWRLCSNWTTYTIERMVMQVMTVSMTHSRKIVTFEVKDDLLTDGTGAASSISRFPMIIDETGVWS